ncbi:Na+/H+ antiporter subunit E [Magnetovibrio blakemorei]|nr:Na+/H+ antiporter subunit E [Magnetovibrio blakemorei]
MLHAFSLGAALMVVWGLLSGMPEPLLMGLGVASVVLTVWIAHRMDVVDHEGHPIHLGPRALVYFPWLIVEIIKANWDVAKIILSPKMDIHPHIFKTKASQKSDVGLTTYANSITLTPGTVTITMDDDGIFEVHALTYGAREGIETLDMDRRCTAMEGMSKTDDKSDKTPGPTSSGPTTSGPTSSGPAS